MTKQIHTIVSDIYDLFRGPHTVNEDNLNKFKEVVGETVKHALQEAGVPRKFELRMSNIGTPDRKLWYDSRDGEDGVSQPKDYIKFLYGHILEGLLLFLAREAGHEVSDEQKTVNLEGIVGHKDCNIDGVLTDVKSASSYSFNKFRDGSFPTVDPFGYRYQLKGYYESEPQTSEELAWLVIDKTTGELILCQFHELELPSATERIKHVKQMLSNPEPPSKCYPTPEPEASGNVPIPKNCEWCKHKFKCWETLKAYQYSTGPKFFVKVEKEPRVEEITHRFKV